MTDKIIEILFKHEEPFQDTGLSFVPRWKYKTIAKELLEAINYKPCCKSDSEQLVCVVDYLGNFTKGVKYLCKPDGLIFFEVEDDFGMMYKVHKKCFKNLVAN